jgi:hypothetical protein
MLGTNGMSMAAAFSASLTAFITLPLVWTTTARCESDHQHSLMFTAEEFTAQGITSGAGRAATPSTLPRVSSKIWQLRSR